MAVSRHIRAARWGGALLVALAPLPWLGMGTAVANPGGQPGNEDNVTICHRTNSVTNPYVVITVDQSSVDGDLGNNKGKGDHYAEHQGPVFDPEADYPPPMSDDDWGDIIPPIEGVHDGLNWTAEGIAIYENDCNIPETVTSSPPVSSSAPASSSEEPTPSESESTDEPSPSESESSEPVSSSGEPSPTTSEPSSAAPSTEISTDDNGKTPETSEPEATETASSGAAALPKTGAGTPVAGAIGISLLLIGVGILLLLGPGRLIPATYHRKH